MMRGGTYDNRKERHDRVGQRNVVAMRPGICRDSCEDGHSQDRTDDARYDLRVGSGCIACILEIKDARCL